ncbi:MAG: hypothetical protein L7H12_01670 [Sulfolobales archaeon]|nr:hypothetical protein [Sulfolobales archaeon]MCG2883456.1 hypothetical protein [Sulfolobales archaeon]MCG2907638.1 hypothetical protein [Sulfolobales archaeon]MCQ4335893.1 hypothetical protein [Sulfolobales archaeon]MCQ4448596.1 hypothetical protein [Sulfolobales archaeon]
MESLFVKFYEDDQEEDYETKEIFPPERAVDVLSALLKAADLKDVEAIDIYYSEIEVAETKEDRDAILIDVIPKSGRDKVYLIYVKDYDERVWEAVRGRLNETLKELKDFNVCDEDREFVSLCRVY